MSSEPNGQLAPRDNHLLRLLMPWRLWSLPPFWRYGLAVLIVAAATVLRRALIPWLGTTAPYNIAFVAVIVTTVLFGIGPGLLSVLLGDIAVEVFVLGAFPMINGITLLRLGSSMAIGGLVIWIFHAVRVSQIRAHDSRVRLAEFAAATFEGIVESRGGRIVDCNQQLAQMLGYTVTELKGVAITDLIAPEDRGRVLGNIRENRETVNEHAMFRKDGTRIIVEVHGRPAPPDSTTRHTAIRDITERKRAEEELRKLNKALKALSDIGQATIRAENEQEYLEEVCRIIIEDCGYSMVWIGFAEDDESKSIRPAAHAGFEEGYLETLELTWADTERGRGPTGTAIRTGKVAVCRNMLTDPAFAPWREQAIQRGYASSIVFPLQAQDTVFGAITIYSREADPFSEAEVKLLTELADDLSYGIEALRTRSARMKAEEELHKLTEELKRSNADLQQFAYAASHDLQEPLRGIAGFTRLLERRYKGKLDEKADEFMDYIIGDATRMQELIKDLLEYSRIETKLKVMKPVNSSVVLEEAFYNLRSAVEETGTELTYDYLPIVMTDASQLKSLFQNLIGNAIKFHGQEKPRIHISAERRGGEWIFSVKDNGIGFESGLADRIFVVFQRLHTRQEYPGTGIGLAICKKIVERHGGRIWAESMPGKGSTFYFTLPVQE